MSRPYFEVNEEVILTGTSEPQLHGDYIVEEYFLVDGKYHAYRLCGMEEKIKHLGYHLGGVEQEVLRKKHPPSDESFSELMTNYTSQSTAKAQP